MWEERGYGLINGIVSHVIIKAISIIQWEPPNKGHIGTSSFVLCREREVVLFWRLNNSY